MGQRSFSFRFDKLITIIYTNFEGKLFIVKVRGDLKGVCYECTKW